jgi:hypothetical protein
VEAAFAEAHRPRVLQEAQAQVAVGLEDDDRVSPEQGLDEYEKEGRSLSLAGRSDEHDATLAGVFEGDPDRGIREVVDRLSATDTERDLAGFRVQGLPRGPQGFQEQLQGQDERERTRYEQHR